MVWAETSFYGLVFLLGQFDLGENGLNKQVGWFGLSRYLE
jgi:hypothetical protein